MTKIQCNLTGLSLLDTEFVVRVVNAVTHARNTDSQVVSPDTDAGDKLFNLSRRLRGQFMEHVDATNEIKRGPDPEKEFEQRGFQSDLAMVYLFCQLMVEMQKYVEPTGLSKDDQMLWDRSGDLAGKVLQWSAKRGLAEDYGIPIILFCGNCNLFSAHFDKKVEQSAVLSCRDVIRN